MAKEIYVPIWEKTHITIEEAAAYTGIGRDKLREICDQNDRLVLWIGRRRLVKRERLNEYLEVMYEL